MCDFARELLLIDKPAGITSFDVIRRLRRVYRVRHPDSRPPKMGHAGTLDPLATGLMLIGVGQGTKQLARLTKLDKEYVAVVRVGEQRSTGDLEGEVVATTPVTATCATLTPDIEAVLATMVGEVALPVPAYSAIKQGGVPLYKRARAAAARGVTLPVAPHRIMRVQAATLLACTPVGTCLDITVRFSVGSGTYIRSLAEALGRRLSYPATLASLRRTRVGEYRIADADTLPEIPVQ